MRATFVSLILFALLGCEGFDEAMKSETTRKPVAPGGIASAGDIDDLAQAPSRKAAPAQKANGETAAATNGTTPQQPAARPQRKIIGKTTAKVVDAQKATQNPKVVIVENKVSGQDPLSVAGSAYVSISSKASTLGFQQALKFHKAEHGKNATYDEFMQMAKQNRVEFSMLPPYQMYGYDQKTGGIVIVEDKAEKIRLYKEQQIPIEPGDKKYE